LRLVWMLNVAKAVELNPDHSPEEGTDEGWKENAAIYEEG
jgi:hypothetical protein